jgi:hypothetical protein
VTGVSTVPEQPVRRPRLDAWGLVLPADWWTIPLADEPQRTRSIAQLVERQFGHADASAVLKRAMLTDFNATAASAAAAGGRLMAVCLLQADGIPVSASLIAYKLAAVSVTGQGVRELESVLAVDAPAGMTLDLGESTTGTVLRKVTERLVSTENELEQVPQLLAEYWLEPTGGGPVLYLTFTTPLVTVRAAMVELFDTIVAGVAPTDD